MRVIFKMISAEKMLELVDGQLNAYNQKNTLLFCQFYHKDVIAYNLSDNSILCQGIQEFQRLYSIKFLENPNMHCKLQSRILLPTFVIDEELISGLKNTKATTHVVAIYHFRDNLIHKICFAR